MSDPRIQQYAAVTTALARGEYRVAIPTDDDDVGQLGRRLSELARALERRQIEDDKLAQVADGMTRGLFLDEVLDEAYEAFRGVIPYDRIGCALLERDGEILRARWARSAAPHPCIDRGFGASMKGSSLQCIIATGEPRILNDLEAYLEAHPRSIGTRRIVSEGMRSSLTCPLVNQGKAIGFLFFSSMTPDTYRDAHQQIFMRIAGQLAAVVERSRLYERMHELNRELLETREQLREQATHDALTGLWNRGAILELLDKHVLRARREGQPLGVVMVDLDHFKRVNDTYGHPVGDEVLREAARRLVATVRGGELVGRYGGEELLVVAYPCRDGGALGERLRAVIANTPFMTAAGPIAVTASLGAVALLAGAGVDGGHAIARADAALYQAKDAGRNRVVAEADGARCELRRASR
jgi:diguanylate cyclase (GGDEF)-like protein